MIFARFYELQALTDDIFTILWAPGAHWWYLHDFMSSRRSLMIFARFYELRALTDDICTFLWAPGFHCWRAKSFTRSLETRHKRALNWKTGIFGRKTWSFKVFIWISASAKAWNRDSNPGFGSAVWNKLDIGIRNQPMWIWNTVELIQFFPYEQRSHLYCFN